MASSEAPQETPYRHGRHLYVRAPRGIEFPSSDPLEEQVGETKRHLENRTLLYLLLRDAFPGAAIGSEQFVYWDARRPRECVCPDVFVKIGTKDDYFDTWRTWERSAPDLAVEIVSPDDHRKRVWRDKLERLEASGIREIVRFDVEDEEQPIRVWDRIGDELLERSPDSERLRECVALGLWWVVVPSDAGPSLRLARDREGKDLLPTPTEARAQAEHARLLAEQKLREETAAKDAEIERLRAELERARGGQR